MGNTTEPVKDRPNRSHSGAGNPSGKGVSLPAVPVLPRTLVAQLTLYSMGDDPRLAKQDMNSFAKRTGETLVAVPIPEMAGEEKMMQLAENPITIFMHGHTLKKNYPVSDLIALLRSKGLERRSDNEIVFITCGAADVLGDRGQKLANGLNAVIHLARGKVVVNDKGIPVVTIKEVEGARQVPADYSDDIKRIIPREAEGWVTFTPQAAVLYREIKKEVERQLEVARKLLAETIKYKENAQLVVKALVGVESIIKEDDLDTVRKGRDSLDSTVELELKSLQANVKEEVSEREAEERARIMRGEGISIEAGSGWDVDNGLNDLDALDDL